MLNKKRRGRKRGTKKQDILGVMEPALSISHLTVAFEGQASIRDVSFELNKGDTLAILGPNGAGKTVMLRALLGSVPYIGTVAWANSTRIGYVPQKIDADRHLPVNFENLLASKADILKLKQNDVDAIIHTVGLDRKNVETPVGHLSGGQFQRALIAFALLGKPNVLILDEPTASIDASGEEQMYELIHRLQNTYAMTVILVSHDLSFVYRYATKVLCLNQSEIGFGTPEEALTPESIKTLYGGPIKFHRHEHGDVRHETTNKEKNK